MNFLDFLRKLFEGAWDLLWFLVIEIDYSFLHKEVFGWSIAEILSLILGMVFFYEFIKWVLNLGKSVVAKLFDLSFSRLFYIATRVVAHVASRVFVTLHYLYQLLRVQQYSLQAHARISELISSAKGKLLQTQQHLEKWLRSS